MMRHLRRLLTPRLRRLQSRSVWHALVQYLYQVSQLIRIALYYYYYYYYYELP